QAAGVGAPAGNDQGHQEAAADLDHEELGRTQRQVGALQLFEDRRLALLGIATAHPGGGRLEEPIERVAHTRRLGQRSGARSRYSVRGKPRLKVLSTARGATHLPSAAETEEDAGE